MALTDYTFRVQALGGKFLADDIGGARVVIRDAVNGHVLAEGVTRGDSGDLIGPAPSSPAGPPTKEDIAVSSKNLIALGDGSASWWLKPASSTSKFVASLDLSRPTQVRVVATGPLGGLQSAAEVRSSLWLTPGQAAPALPGYVIELPGLLVQPLFPYIHTQVPPGSPISFIAKVTMMCGCQITRTSASQAAYWPDSDFVVQARVEQIGVDGVTTFPMPITAESSIFQATAKFDVPAQGSGSLFYQVTFTAFQISTGNSGTATVNFYCTFPA